MLAGSLQCVVYVATAREAKDISLGLAAVRYFKLNKSQSALFSFQLPKGIYFIEFVDPLLLPLLLPSTTSSFNL